MINKEIVRAARKRLSLSQYDLAADITTQSTVSRMEREGVAPAPEVTAKLLSRLQLRLSDVLINPVPDFKLYFDQADEAAIAFNYEKVLENINKIDLNKLVTENDRLHLEFLRANATMWTSKDFMQGMFDFKKLLDSAKHNTTSIYYVLSVCQLGKAYFTNQKNDAAKYYFDQLPALLDYMDVSKNLFWVLSIYDNLIDFLSKIEKYDQSLKYAKDALTISEKYQTYAFVASISENIGRDYAICESWNSKNTQRYFLQSWVFAQIEHNNTMLQTLKNEFQNHGGLLISL
ncbi:helix-turn-helix domain-containing protein [Furfurilactobacillus milii]|uniref:helix-turn-helix domain-containing protein n=1 Tax=Furfurilactobacillus milii TaxID=2888272 RepID=UPI001370D1E8|nr:helix-turn-helix transcriptional regulator [Furfurilactobacillus milii]